MKMFIKIYIILCLFFIINSTCGTDEDDVSMKFRDYDDCKNRAFDSEELEENAYRCCHIEIETKTINTEKSVHGCIAITESQFNNIKQTVHQYEAASGVDEVDLDCESSYIKYGFFCLILFLI